MSDDDGRVTSGSPYEDRYGFCRGLRLGPRIEIAGTAPIPQDDSPLPNSAHDQMLLCGRIAKNAVAQLGGGRVIRTRMYITDAAYADEVGRAHATLFGDAQPVATMVVVAALLDERWKVELEVEAVADTANSRSGSRSE